MSAALFKCPVYIYSEPSTKKGPCDWARNDWQGAMMEHWALQQISADCLCSITTWLLPTTRTLELVFPMKCPYPFRILDQVMQMFRIYFLWKPTLHPAFFICRSRRKDSGVQVIEYWCKGSSLVQALCSCVWMVLIMCQFVSGSQEAYQTNLGDTWGHGLRVCINPG